MSGTDLAASGPSESAVGVVAIIPAYNEADRIAATVQAARSVPEVARVVVVDDGSTDDTTLLAVGAGASQVVTLVRNLGKGGALNAGVRETTEPVLLLLDADLESSAREASKLVDPVLEGAADMTVGTFPRTGAGGGMGLAVGLARWGVRRLTGRTLSAPLSGQRCLRREVIQACGGFESGFGVETALNIDAIRARFRVLEVETTMGHRVTGRDLPGTLHRARQFRDIAMVLARRAIRRRPAQ